MIGRLLVASIFIASGLGRLADTTIFDDPMEKGYSLLHAKLIKDHGITLPLDPTFMASYAQVILTISGAYQLIAVVLFTFKVRSGAWMLVFYLVLTNFMIYNPMLYSEPGEHQKINAVFTK
jgi:uncharacterized membrane protein YphA (DoxX/SURF4 family)